MEREDKMDVGGGEREWEWGKEVSVLERQKMSWWIKGR